MFERVVARLEAAEPGRWVLKGGMALEARLRDDARLTKDIDLGLRDEVNEPSELHERVVDALGVDLDGDRFTFTAAAPTKLAEDDGGQSTWRVKVAAALGGKTFGGVQLDVSPRAHELDATDRLTLPNSLDFAGIPPPVVEIIDVHRHAAEKFHAMLRDFGDRENSRVRDLIDLVLLIEHDLLLADIAAAAARRVWAERDGLDRRGRSRRSPRPGPNATSGSPRSRRWTPSRSPRRPPAWRCCGLRCSRPRRPERMARTKKAAVPVSPQAKLAAVIKSARDAMRKDAGLNGDLDRIPQLAWLLFLKAFDGLEQSREVTDDDFRPAIQGRYRWRDWAADPDGATGEALLTFVNGELLPYLRSLSGTGSHDPRDVLAAVFKETNNRMLSGYLLRDVVNKINEINFASSDDIHTMAHVYESMLREMRDAAGDSGEFYTPRPLIRFMVQQVDPKLGEIVLDPACGTGGFLVETLEHLAPKVTTTQQRRALHKNLRGVEKKPLPYLLGMMNLVLHGFGSRP